MPISFHCPHCQRQINAPDSAGGKRAKCPGCSEVLTIPTEEIDDGSELVEVGPDPFGGVEAAPLDQPMPMGRQQMGQQMQSQQMPNAYAAPTTPAKPVKHSGGDTQFQYSPIELLTAIACIVHGCLTVGPLLWIAGISIFFSFMSLFGLVTLALVASSTTVLVCGIGILLKQSWAVPVGAMAGGIYFAIIFCFMIMGFIGMIASGMAGYLSFTFFLWTLPRTLISWAGPGLLIFMHQNEP